MPIRLQKFAMLLVAVALLSATALLAGCAELKDARTAITKFAEAKPSDHAAQPSNPWNTDKGE